MKYQTLAQIYESLSDDLKAAEKALEIVRAALNQADPDGRMKSGALIDAQRKASDRVFRLRNALEDFEAQEW